MSRPSDGAKLSSTNITAKNQIATVKQPLTTGKDYLTYGRMELKNHPIANLLPPAKPHEIEYLAGSLLLHGLRDPIVLYEKQILDGRTRYLACQMAGVEPRTEAFDGDNPFAFVLQKNLQRHKLIKGQRSMLGARMVALSNAGTGIVLSLKDVAPLVGVNPDIISSATRILENATPEEIALVDTGKRGIQGIIDIIRTRPLAPRRIGRRKGLRKTITMEARTAERRNNMTLWKELRAALESFGHMPQPADMVAVVKGVAHSERTLANIAPIVEWLIEFNHALENGKKDNHVEKA